MNIDNDFHKEVDATSTTIINTSIIVSIVFGILFVCYVLYRFVMG
jgi:heme/copper-type cytochrome/quinol oxidase subunit 2